ncbi:MAG: hypothetical protein B6D55_03485 [Candidatus Omnitrophica bacterium 4484_70.2]|nr:MAG: hypothetical protein B6D55_03485 [Candidatus Omnitrophica bacterium 4484_70.2]
MERANIKMSKLQPLLAEANELIKIVAKSVITAKREGDDFAICTLALLQNSPFGNPTDKKLLKNKDNFLTLCNLHFEMLYSRRNVTASNKVFTLRFACLSGNRLPRLREYKTVTDLS